jgi:hypothetical protein
MLRKPWLAAVVAGAGVALLALAAPAHAASGGWRIAERLPSHGKLQAGAIPQVSAITSGWAFAGDGVGKPTAWERKGTTWTQVPFPGQAGEFVTVAAAASPRDVWAFTVNGPRSRALRWNGATWTIMRTFSQVAGGAAVLGSGNVWVFGEPYVPGNGLGTWHYNGSSWTQVPGGAGLIGGSALSASNIWAFGGTEVAHWNGQAWTRTSVTSLLPAKQELNDPQVAAIIALSADNVYAIGDGNMQDARGPIDILHYNGRGWTTVVAPGPLSQGGLAAVASDGSGGLWLSTVSGLPGTFQLLHYSGGKLTPASLPAGSGAIDVRALALIPGTSDVLAGGFTHAPASPASNPAATILEYAPDH